MDIVRVPIKIRQPIFKDYCNCWGIKVFAIDGEAQYIIADGVEFDVLVEFLKTVEECLPVHFSEPFHMCEHKIRYVLSMGIPVVVKTKEVLPEGIIKALGSVPHSGIHLNINYLDPIFREKLDESASTFNEIREMLYTAKAIKVFTTLVVDYKPHLVSKLDLLEIIDEVKNYVSHMLISFSDISDEEHHTTKYSWEALKPSAKETFKKYYTADVLKRTWVMRPKIREEITTDLLGYLKGKKIGLEVIDAHEDFSNWIRHVSTGISELPLGIRPFFYESSVEGFVKKSELQGCSCPKCGKPIFA